jgi:urease accessory protein
LDAAVAIERRETFAANRAVGRIALTIAHDGTRSRRTRVYEDGPLRARFPKGDALDAVIINTAGGVAGGDRFAFDIDVGAHAELTLTTAAADKVYRALDDEAIIGVKLTVDRGGSLRWLPQETILFDQACLRRDIEIDVASDARLVLAESVVFGRTAMGERMLNGRLIDRWRVRRAGELVYADTARLDGSVGNLLAHPAVAAGGCAIGTLLVMPADAGAIDRLRTLAFDGEVGVSAWNDFMLARLAARDGQGLRRDIRLLLTKLGERLPQLWLN